jgi:nucleoside-diphosphate-sugar epimerase
MESACDKPLNLGSERMISINGLTELIANRVNKNIVINNIDGPLGVMGRNSHNAMIEQEIGWRPGEDLEFGIDQTYAWIKSQIDKGEAD